MMQLCKGRIERSQISSLVLLQSNCKIGANALCVCLYLYMSVFLCESSSLLLMATPLPVCDLVF